jgi:hypothetical protein
MPIQKVEHEYHYFRVVVTYSDGETSGHRVFKERKKAEKWAERQKKSATVKKVTLQPFVRDAYDATRVGTGSKSRPR